MSSADQSYSEKRDFIRMRINSQVDINHDGKQYQGICKDLSATGMLIDSSHAFELGSELKVSIAQKGDNRLPFNAIAEVSRIQVGEANRYIVALTIKEITP